jgi:hypothetical protein
VCEFVVSHVSPFSDAQMFLPQRVHR